MVQNSPRKTNSRFCPSSFKSNNIQFDHTVYLKLLSFFSLVVPIPLDIHFSDSPNTHMWVLCQIPLLLFPIVMLILRVCPRPARNGRASKFRQEISNQSIFRQNLYQSIFRQKDGRPSIFRHHRKGSSLYLHRTVVGNRRHFCLCKEKTNIDTKCKK